MAQQIKKKYLKSDSVDGSKIKLLKDQALRAEDSSGVEVKLLELGSSNEVLSKGQEIAFKSQLLAEEAARIAGDAAEASARAAAISAEEAARIAGDAAEASARAAADSAIQSSLNSEISRAQAAEGVLTTNLAAEVTRATAAEAALQVSIDDVDGYAQDIRNDLDQEILDRAAGDAAEASARAAAISAEASARAAAISAEEAARIAGDAAEASARAAAISAEEAARIAGDQNLQAQINNVISNVDPAALDSLTEIVAAFEAADQNLNNTIIALGTASQSALAAEIARATAAEEALASDLAAEIARAESAEEALASDLAAEIARATAAEGVLTADLAAEVTRAESAEEALASDLAAEVTRATAAEGVLTADLAAEVARAESAEEALASDLQSEVERAMAAEGVLTADLQSEVERATAAEELLTDSKVAKAGDTMTGALTIDPVGDGMNYTMIDSSYVEVYSSLPDGSYTDVIVQTDGFSLSSDDGSGNGVLMLLSSQNGGTFNIMKNGEAFMASGESDIATKKYVDQQDQAILAQAIVYDDAVRSYVDAVTGFMDGRLEGLINTEESERIAADENLQAQINNIVSNVDPAALDSLTEIVAAFQAADENLNNAISALGTGSSSGLAAEIARATAAEAAIAADLAAEVARAQAAEGVLTSDLAAEVARATAAEEALSSRVSALEALNDGPEFHKKKVVVGAELSFVELDHEAIENSIMVSVGRMAVHKDEDYTVSVVGGKTRLSWIGDFAVGGLEAIEAGDCVFITYAISI
jgi:hypothetical protein